MKKAKFLHSPGVVCTLGSGLEEVAEMLFSSSPKPLNRTDTYSPGVPLPVGLIAEELLAADDSGAWPASRCNRILVTALAQIRDQVDSLTTRYPADRIGVVLGTSTSGIAEAETAFASENAAGHFPGDYRYAVQEIGQPAQFLSHLLGLCGPAVTVSTACSSSAKALASASRLLDSGFCDAVICGGVDTLCQLTVNGFRALDSVSDEVCIPMSRNRNGINIGEAACLFVLSGEPAPVVLSGYGETSDAHHISAPHPQGDGARRAMQVALANAQLRADQIGYVNLHGTATPQNDYMESRAVAEIFGLETHCSSTKPLTGHTLGAAGAIEAAICWMALQSQKLPPHWWDEQRDPDLAPLSLVPPGQETRHNLKHALSNSFAFGGNNIALILSATGLQS